MKNIKLKHKLYLAFIVLLIVLLLQVDLPFSKWFLVMIPFAIIMVLGFLLLLSMTLMGLIGWAYMWISKTESNDTNT